MSGGRRLFVVRHGEAAASWGQSADPGLSPLGHEQARQARDSLLERLGATEPTLISSPLRRARETAAPLAEHLDLPVVIDERFREIPSPVPLAGRQEWLRAFMRGAWVTQDQSLHEWRTSILRALDELPDHGVVFTHFLVLNAAVGWHEGREETLVFWPANASITELHCDAAGNWRAETGAQMQTRVN